MLTINFTEGTLKVDKNGKTTPTNKQKMEQSVSRYGSFYLRLGGIGNYCLVIFYALSNMVRAQLF